MILLYILYIFLVGVSAIDQDPPTQLHIALAGRDVTTGSSDGITISYVTLNATATSTVKYGTSSGKYDMLSSGSQASYWESFHHHVTLPSLQPDEKYYYVAGDDASGWSEEFSFDSPMSTSTSADEAWNFAMFGDLGIHLGTPTIATLKDWAENKEVDMIWHAGDVGYADDSYLHVDCLFNFCYESVYDEYMSAAEPWTSTLPYMVTPGNHEADCHDPACLSDPAKREKLSNFTTYNTRFKMPAEESGATALNMHYSFNYKNVHFISLDTETGYPGAQEETRYVLPCGGFTQNMLEWLEADLIQANKERERRPWIFAAGHRPMYQGGTTNTAFQTAVENLFLKYKVDVYFSGHVHQYERNWPVYDGEVPSNDDATAYENPPFTTYLIVGGAGNDEMVKNLRTFKDPTPTQIKADPNYGPWTAFRDTKHRGIGKVRIQDANTLSFDYVISETGKVFDTITLTRER